MTSKLEQFVASDKKPKEPAANIGTTVGFLTAVFVLVNNFWPNIIKDNVQEAIISIAAILLPFITSLLIRRKVWSPASVEDLLEEAVTEANSSNNPPTPPAPRLM